MSTKTDAERDDLAEQLRMAVADREWLIRLHHNFDHKTAASFRSCTACEAIRRRLPSNREEGQ